MSKQESYPGPKDPFLSSLHRQDVKTRVAGATDLKREVGDRAVQERVDVSNLNTTTAKILFGPDNQLLTRDRGYEDNYQLERVFDKPRLFEELAIDSESTLLMGVNIPTAGYSEGSLMTIAGEGQRCHENLPGAFLIYDAPEAFQVEYWRQVLTILNNAQHFFTDRIENYGNVTVQLIGHHGRDVKTPEHNALRTLALHHDHITFVNDDALKPHEWDQGTFRIPAETKLFNRHLRNRSPSILDFVTRLNQRFSIFEDRILEFELRTAEPFGYQIDFDTERPSLFARFMYHHFQAYQEIATELQDEIEQRVPPDRKPGFWEKQIIQPAFGVVIRPTLSRIAKVYFMPAIADVGPVERMGIELRRGVDYPAQWKTSDEDDRIQRLHEAVMVGV